MRYWVYQDSRILGPFGKEELRSVEGLDQASLVCPDNNTGTRELDWVPLENIEDLSSVFGPAKETQQQTAIAAGNFDEFSQQAHASLEKIGSGENWMEAIQRDPRLSDLWGAMPEDIGPEKNWELQQNSAFENRFTELQEKLDVQERRQNEILDRLGEKDRQLEEKDRTIAQLRAQLGGAEVAPPPPPSSTTVESRVASGAPEMVPFGDDLDVPEPVSRFEPVESGDAVSDGPLMEPDNMDAPGAPTAYVAPEENAFPSMDDTVSEPPIDAAPAMDSALGLEQAPALGTAPELESVPALDAVPGLEAAPALDAVPGLDEAPALDAIAGMEAFPSLDEPGAEAISESAAVDEFGVPEATPLKSVSEMPSVEEFLPPTPDEATDLAPPDLEMPPLEAPSDFPTLDVPPLDAPPLDVSGLEVPPPLDAPPLEGGNDGPPMPIFDAPPLEPPPLSEALGPPAGAGEALPLTMPSATPETIDLSAPAGEAVAPDNVAPPPGDDPFAAPKTMMMGGMPTPALSAGPGLNLTPPPAPMDVGGGDLVGGMPPGMEGPPGSTPMPIPLDEGNASGTPQLTPMPSMGQPDLPQTVMQGLGVSGMPTPMPMENPTPAPGLASAFQDITGGQGAPTPLPAIPGAELPAGGSPPTMMPLGVTPIPGAAPSDAGSLEVQSDAAPKQSTADKLKAQVGKLGGKKFLIGLVVAVLVLAGLLFMFLRNPKDVVKMAEMGPEKQTQGSFDVDSTENGPGGPAAMQKSSPLDQAPQQAAPQEVFPQAPPQPQQQQAPPQQQVQQQQAPPQEQQAPQQQAPPQAPPQEAAPRRAFISDQRIDAIEFVKGYKIGGGKTVVAQRLQYYFLGGDNIPEWTAGAIEKNKWFVEYHVFKGRGGGRRKKPTVTYRFEVDLAAKTVKGLNGRARTLLGNSGSRKRSPSRRRSSSSRQAPLPSEDQLEGSRSSQAGSFNNPGE